MPLAELVIAKNIFKDALRIIKTAIHRDRMNIGRARTGHLPLLQRRHPALWIKNENRRIGFAQQPMNCRRPGIAGSRAEDVDPLPAPLALILVEVAQQLERKILKRQRRSVE